jgi:amphi-Trp domain-containing protein
MSAAIPARYRGHARRDAAAFYLGELGRSILAGEIAVTDGNGGDTTLAAAEYVQLTIEIKQKKRADQVHIKVKWPKRPLIRAGRFAKRTP